MQISDREHELLAEVLRHMIERGASAPARAFRLRNEQDRHLIDSLTHHGFLSVGGTGYRLTLTGLQTLVSPLATSELEECENLLGDLQNLYRQGHAGSWTTEQIANLAGDDVPDVARRLTYLSDLPIFGSVITDSNTGFVKVVEPSELILDAVIPPPFQEARSDLSTDYPANPPKLTRIGISGYRAFEGFDAPLDDLTIIIGANASGKSSLFDFLRFLSFAAVNQLPPEIDPGSVGRVLFHAGGPERIAFDLVVDLSQKKPLRYTVEIRGPIGTPLVSSERLTTTEPLVPTEHKPFVFLDFHAGRGVVRDQVQRRLTRPQWTVQANELALRRALDPTLVTLSRFQSFLASWTFYSGFDVSASAATRRPVATEPNPTLTGDGANLSAVLFWLMTEHMDVWTELETHLRTAIPGFLALSVKAQGGPGTVIGVWRELDVTKELTLADLSDGTLRLLCWAALCLSPSIPSLVCIDEPELGLHPRVLPILAGLLRFASSRSQLLVATHSPYFLSQFSLDEIAVMRKEAGRAVFLRPASSKALLREIEELGGEALMKLHITDELEARS